MERDLIYLFNVLFSLHTSKPVLLCDKVKKVIEVCKKSFHVLFVNNDTNVLHFFKIASDLPNFLSIYHFFLQKMNVL